MNFYWLYDEPVMRFLVNKEDFTYFKREKSRVKDIIIKENEWRREPKDEASAIRITKISKINSQ